MSENIPLVAIAGNHPRTASSSMDTAAASNPATLLSVTDREGQDEEGETDFGEGSRQTELAYTNHQNLLPLCWPSIICWGITFVLEVVVYIIVRIFEEKPYEQSTLQPILFIMRSWIILLAFVSLHTFKVMALDARWLCFRAQTVENTDADILRESDNPFTVLYRACISKRFQVAGYCGWFLVCILVAQYGVVSLFWKCSTIAASQDVLWSTQHGSVFYQNLTLAKVFANSTGLEEDYSDFKRLSGFDEDPYHFGRFSMVHQYGIVGSRYNTQSVSPLKNIAGTIADQKHPVLWSDEVARWKYIFTETSVLHPSHTSLPPSIYSYANISSEASCSTPLFKMRRPRDDAPVLIVADSQYDEIVDDMEQTWDWNYTALDSHRQFFPAAFEWRGTVSYVTTLDETYAEGSCGLGCSNVKVLEKVAPDLEPGMPLDGSMQTFYFYDCNITVHPVDSLISSENAAVAAKAIALSEFTLFYPHDGPWIADKARLFTSSIGYDRMDNSSGRMASYLSKHASGVIAAAAATVPQEQRIGPAPVQGAHLKVEGIFYLVPFAIVACQALLLYLLHKYVMRKIRIPYSVGNVALSQLQERFGMAQTGGNRLTNSSVGRE